MCWYEYREQRSACTGDLNVTMHAYWGPEYANDTIKDTLDKIGALRTAGRSGWTLRERSRRPEDGRVVPGADGIRARALGNRSILADPRSAGMKDRINLGIKYR
jgi:carbamoyltransferase